MNPLKAFIPVCISLFLLIQPPGLSFAGQLQPVQAKAQSIDELAARYDVTDCRGCHEEVFEQWEQSMHARSMVGSGSGRTRATFKTLVTRGLTTWPYSGVKRPEDVKIEHLMICARCHLPQLAEADDAVAQEIIKAVWARDNQTLGKLSINCLICHQRNAIIHKWVHGYPRKDAIYGTINGGHEDNENCSILLKHPLMEQSILCGQCHGLGPGFGYDHPTQCATAYGGYLWAYIPEGGHQTCQECHIRDYAGGHAMLSYRDDDMQAKAVDIQVDAQTYHWRKNKKEGVIPLAVVNIELTNQTGHGLPDG